MIERILAVVDGRPVTLNEVRLVELIRGVERRAATDAVIDERLMFEEASRLPQAGADPEEEERAYRALLARVPAALRSAETELRALARRQTAILRYIEFRFRPQVRVRDEDLARAYQAELGGAAGAPTLEEAAPALRRRLEQRDLDERIEAWVRDLRSAAAVRYNP